MLSCFELLLKSIVGSLWVNENISFELHAVPRENNCLRNPRSFLQNKKQSFLYCALKFKHQTNNYFGTDRKNIPHDRNGTKKYHLNKNDF